MKALFLDYVDDVKAVSTSTYKSMRKKHFSHLNEDLSFLDDYKTIAVLALSFPHDKPKLIDKHHAMVSRYAHGLDYHTVFEEKLRTLEARLKDKGIKAKGSVDISTLDERFAAFLSGMGFLGHNRFLIHPRYGTHIYLATMLLDVDFTTEKAPLDDCKTCRLCIEACPTNALEVGRYHEKRCLSFLSQEKEPIPRDYGEKLQMIFGCDICQDVCPKNQGITPVNREVFKSDKHAQIHLETLLKTSNKALAKTYQQYAFAWRGISVLKRNALWIIHNRKLEGYEPLIKETLKQYQNTPWLKSDGKKLFKP